MIVIQWEEEMCLCSEEKSEDRMLLYFMAGKILFRYDALYNVRLRMTHDIELLLVPVGFSPYIKYLTILAYCTLLLVKFVTDCLRMYIGLIYLVDSEALPSIYL